MQSLARPRWLLLAPARVLQAGRRPGLHGCPGLACRCPTPQTTELYWSEEGYDGTAGKQRHKLCQRCLTLVLEAAVQLQSVEQAFYEMQEHPGGAGGRRRRW